MKFPRLTISNLAVLVGVVAVNLGVGLALSADNVFLLDELALMGLALQLGGLRFFRTHGLTRAFWAGFVFGGLGAMYSLLWVFLHENNLPANSPLGWVAWKVWEGYGELAISAVQQTSYGKRLLQSTNHGLELGVLISVVFFLPQLVIALAAGLMTRQIARCRVIRSDSGDGAAQVPRTVD